ncbi:hypothetical protein ACFQ9V_19890 [Leifsonia sp. NPDC056665]|uniref:hypothetical protein n=1 Tax=Leifsonia sp. NPDC056665 TaxID=3345901 RepID=UPI0036BE6838
MWGVLAGVIAAALVAYPLAACIAFATHPATRRLFGERLSSASQAGFQAFWWVTALLCAALPLAVGFGIARLSGRVLAVVGAGVALLVVLVVVLAQFFAF